MLSLRAAAARTRAASAIPTLSTSVRRPITNDAEPDRQKRQSPPSTLMDNAPGWNEDLATSSEASVKADRETTTIDEMKQKTVVYAQSHYDHPNDREVEQTHAAYARDEVSGPLGNSGVGEFEGVVGNDDLGPDHDANTQVESNGRIVTRRTSHEKTTVHEGQPAAKGQANVSRDRARRPAF